MESIIQDTRECYICASPYVEEHHLISGTSNRALAEADGLKIYLCRKHHEEAHRDPKCNLSYKRLGQIYFEQSHTREEFIKRYGKSFIDKDLEKLGGFKR